jgi:hypothetical protein
MAIEPVSGNKPWDLQAVLDMGNSSLTPGYQIDLTQLDPTVATVASLNLLNAEITIKGMEFEVLKQASNQCSQGCNKLIFSNG